MSGVTFLLLPPQHLAVTMGNGLVRKQENPIIEMASACTVPASSVELKLKRVPSN